MRWRFAVVAVLVSAGALAQGTLEIIPLRHRTVEQVLPALRPLVEPGGVLSGQGNQLIVRTSPRNLAEIRAALAAIDAPLRRLQISVRFEAAGEAERSTAAARGSVGRDASRIELRAHDSRAAFDERVDQRVQVLEGGRAFIATGQTRPLRERQVVRTPDGSRVVTETTTLQDTSTGFAVVPRLAGGGSVIVDIAPQRETPGPGGTVQGERLVTTVQARLGEWFELGGTGGTSAGNSRGILSYRDTRSAESRRIWLKVEELGP